jgi:hypothetical protein
MTVGSFGAPPVDYAKQHAVLALLTSLIETLLLERPNDPLAHLIEVLKNGQVSTSTAQRYFSVTGTSSSDTPAPPAPAAAAAMTVEAAVQNVAAPATVAAESDLPVADVDKEDTTRGVGGGEIDEEGVASSDADPPQQDHGAGVNDGDTSVIVPEAPRGNDEKEN